MLPFDLSAYAAQLRRRVGLRQIAISGLILSVGLLAGRSLSRVDSDLDIIYQEYTLAAVELAHISSDVLRYRVTIVRAVESRSRREFESITGSLAEQRARIQHAVDRYAAASLRVSRSGRSEPEDLQAVRASLEAYFAAASRTVTLLIQEWSAVTPEAAARFHQEAELHAADNAGPKMIQVSLALDRLLLTVSDVARDLRDEGSASLKDTTTIVLAASVFIGILNLIPVTPRERRPVRGRRQETPVVPARSRTEPSTQSGASGLATDGLVVDQTGASAGASEGSRPEQ